MNGKNRPNKVYNASFIGEAIPVQNKARQKTNKSTKLEKNASVSNNPPRAKADRAKATNRKKLNPKPVKPNPGANRKAGSKINESIRVQTKSSRTKGRQEKKVTGSAKNLEIRRRNHSEKKTYRIKKKRNNFKYFGTFFVIYFVIFLMVAGLLTFFFYIELNNGTDDCLNTVSVTIGNDDNDRLEFDSSDYYRNGVYYISPEDVNELFDLTVTGDKKTLKYVLDGNNDNISFEIGTRNAFVNGQNVVLESDCFLDGGRLYVPASFFQNYVSGVKISLDREKGIKIERIETGKEKDGSITYQELGFSLKQNNTIPVIPEESISK